VLLSISTADRCLTQSRGFVLNCFQGVPRRLSSVEHCANGHLSKELLNLLQPIKDDKRETQTTFREFWFQLAIENKGKLIPAEQEPETKEKMMISIPKMIFTSAVSANVVHAVGILPKGRKSDSEYD
jgi:hypothetical protein